MRHGLWRMLHVPTGISGTERHVCAAKSAVRARVSLLHRGHEVHLRRPNVR